MKSNSIYFAIIILLLTLVGASATTFYVNVNSANPAPPYADWSTAASDIQSAIDAASDGDQILVTNGVYLSGGRVVYGSLTNRVVIDKAVIVQSMNGPEATVIQGYQVPVTVTGDSAIRCVYLTNNAALIGFTLTNGATRSTGDIIAEQSGGGAWCESTNSMLMNCLVISNRANAHGGGVRGGINNGGQYGGYGGASLVNCRLTGNSAQFTGGGATICTLINCTVDGNFIMISGQGGGTSGSILINCTICSNSMSGSFDGTLKNCVVYYNGVVNLLDCNATNCCSTPLPSGFNNFTNAPSFVNTAIGDFHLQSNSPCINAGNNRYVSSNSDFDGNPRIVGGTVDVGAYEYQAPSSVLSYVWAQQYGLLTDGTADYADTDGDGINNYAEWKAGTVPTNAASVLQLASPTKVNPGLTVTWQSVNGITYYLQSSTNLSASPAFTSIQSNLVGHAGTTSYTDVTATNGGAYFYRVGVQ